MAHKYILFSFVFLSLFLPSGSIKAGEVVKLPNYSLKYSAKTSATKSTIWNLWADVENWKNFDVRLQYSYLVDDMCFEQGAVGYLKAKNAPKTKFEITKLKKLVSFTEKLKIPLYQTIDLQRYFEKSDDGSTVFTHEVNFNGALRPVMYALLKGPFKKDLKLVVERLKEIAESEDPKTLPQRCAE